MKVLSILLSVAFASGFSMDKNETHEEKIVGGNKVGIEYVPYQASLFWFRMNYFCGATIIHKFWLITAAHCMKNKSHISVRTGNGHREILGKMHRVEQIIMHEDYVSNSESHDIALIQLVEPIQFNNEQQPIELAKPYDIPITGELMQISGFGRIGAAYVPVRNQENCERVYRPLLLLITDNMFCAGNGDANACSGDSGGPGVIRGKLYGIISFGVNCTSSIYPEVYTRVPKYYQWIVEKTGFRF